MADVQASNEAVAGLIKDGEFAAAAVVLQHLEEVSADPAFPRLSCLSQQPQALAQRRSALQKSMLDAMALAAQIKPIDAVIAKICSMLRVCYDTLSLAIAYTFLRPMQAAA